MSRRRRKGNKLLGRILLISVIVHVIAIPILAKFGAFEKIKREFMTNTVTVIPPPPPDQEKPVEKKAEQKKQVAKAKGPSHENHAQAHSNAPHPPVVASNAPTNGGGDDNGPTIDPNGTGKAGIVPKDTGPQPGAGNGGTQPGADTKPAPQPAAKPTPQPETKPQPTPEPPKPHVPVVALAEAVYQPQPEVPDDLRADALDKTCVVEISVDANGAPADVKVGQSSGVDELDQIALAAAKKWKFKPATSDGTPIPSLVRLHIQFKVD